MSAYLLVLIKKLIAHGTDLLRGALRSVSWLPVLSLSKVAITSLFAHIEHGTLIVIDEGTGKTEAYGQRIARENSKLTNGISGKPKQGSGVGKVELRSQGVFLGETVLVCGHALRRSFHARRD